MSRAIAIKVERLEAQQPGSLKGMNDDELRKLIAEEIGHLGFEISPALSILEEFGAERGWEILQQMAEDR